MFPKSLRGAIRFATLVGGLLEALVRFAPIFVRCRGRVPARRRIEWLHVSCRRIARQLSLEPAAARVKLAGLTVSNHLSYLDILAYGAASPFLFVAESEVRRWPLLGILARLGGTIFVDRARPLQVAGATRQLEQSLRDGLPVLLFPEGTTSDGRSVLLFKPPLFEPAMRAGVPITAAAIRYSAMNGAEEQVTWWGDMVFLPHLLNTLSLRGLRARITFGEPRRFPDRKTAARLAQEEVQALRSESDVLCASPFTGSPVDVVSIGLCPQPRKTAST